MLTISQILMDYETAQVGPMVFDHLPAFGWKLQSDGRGILQSSYRLQICQTGDFAAPLFDSGTVQSAQSVQVAVRGVRLASAQCYHVRVRVTAGREDSGWSAPVRFLTALLAPAAEWKAPFISAETSAAYIAASRGTYVRGAFAVRGPLRAAYAFTTALGLYNFYLNGQKVGADEMTPGWTSYRRNLLYQTYEVSACLHPGQNAAGAMLGAGWYKGVMGLTRAHNNYGPRTAFAMQLVLEYADGTRETVTTGPDWQGADSPVVFSEIYHGETYDAALEQENWACAGAPQSAVWRPVAEEPWDTAVLRAQGSARVQVIDRLPAQRVFRTPGGDLVVDFGQNMTGRIEVCATGRPGDVMELRCFETLDAAGNVYLENLRKAKTTMKYVFARAGQITWRPQFTYMGFRYAVVRQFPGTAAPANFTGCTLHTRMAPAGELHCSNPLLNQLHHNYLWGLKGNFLDVPTDCPQRDERLGWTGDAQIFCRTACYLMDADPFYRKWLLDVAGDQLPDGGVPHVVPNIEEGRGQGNWLLSNSPYGASAWGDAAVILPWTLYRMYGDTEILVRQYPSMKAWIDFMRAHAPDDQFGFQMQLGDWVALDAEPGSYFGATPTALTCQAYYAYSTGLFAKTAAVLGKTADAAAYQALYARVAQKFAETYFTPEGDLTAQTQTAHIVALYFGLTPKKYKARTVAGLKRLLAAQKGHLVTGFIGTPYFCLALSQNGCVQEAYDLLLKEDFPSWLYQVKRGATTVWEHWDGLKPDGSMWSAGMNSFNHYAYGAIGEWMYRVMAGLDMSEGKDGAGFRQALLYPRIGGGLQNVEAWHETAYGPLRTRWAVQGEEIALTVSIPPNTTALVRLDAAKAVRQADGLTFVPWGDTMQARAGSGTYAIRYTR